MSKTMRISLGGTLLAIGVIFFILPGSILFALAGLMLLSVDIPQARTGLRWCQRSMSNGARKLDRMILARKFR